MWDSSTGFGGNGNPDKQQMIGRWNYDCVIDGPFRDLRPAYFKGEYLPHCLTRTFNDGTEEVGRMFGDSYSPDTIAEIHSLSSYDEFRINLEKKPHGAIHSSIGGDMSPATSPNGRSLIPTLLRR